MPELQNTWHNMDPPLITAISEAIQGVEISFALKQIKSFWPSQSTSCGAIIRRTLLARLTSIRLQRSDFKCNCGEDSYLNKLAFTFYFFWNPNESLHTLLRIKEAKEMKSSIVHLFILVLHHFHRVFIICLFFTEILGTICEYK